jgi:hypothetical protein
MHKPADILTKPKLILIDAPLANCFPDVSKASFASFLGDTIDRSGLVFAANSHSMPGCICIFTVLARIAIEPFLGFTQPSN